MVRRQPGAAPAMLEFTGLHFVGLNVRDAEASIVWYGQVLGLTRVQQAREAPHHRGAAILVHRASGLLVGLIALRDNAGEPVQRVSDRP